MTSPALAFIDSGLGGLSVWREAVALRPGLSTLYVADQAHVPYGPKPLETVLGYAEAITQALMARGVRVVVLASNTTSAAALYPLRQRHPDVAFVGMEPALKPAIEQTRSQVVGVLATPGTFQGQPFAKLMQRFSGETQVLTQPCPGWVEAVERGDLDSPETLALVRRYVDPLIDAGADVLVLGCTHYPFLSQAIQAAAGLAVTVIDPAPSVARQALRVWDGLALPSVSKASHHFFTTASPEGVAPLVQRLLPQSPAFQMASARWQEGTLVLEG